MTSPLSKAEKSYIQTGLLSTSPSRTDGRSLHEFRSVALETGVAPLANGSAKLSIGRSAHDGAGGTQVLAAVKVEVENVADDMPDTGRVVCTVSCSPAAYPHLNSNALDDLQYDMTTIVHQTLSHPTLLPKNLGILPRKKAWLLNLDIIVLADSGNVYDAIFMAARAALWDTKVPRTRSIEYKAKKGESGTSTVIGQASISGDMDVDEEGTSGFDTRQISNATDFELPDYWDEGEVLDGRQFWPICVTLNVVSPVYFLDATSMEEAATPIRLLLIYSFPTSSSANIQAMRMLGTAELTLPQIQDFVKECETHARNIFVALNTKLKDEDLRRNQKARDRFERR